MKIKFLTYLLLHFTCLYASASEAALDSASKAYDNGEYAKAAQIYENVMREKGSSSYLYANLANAYVKVGDYGKGRLYYERSLLLDPSDKEVKNNLNYIVTKITDSNIAEAKGKKISAVPDAPTFFSSIRNSIVLGHTPDTWAVWAAISFILFCVCVSLYVFIGEVIVRKIGFFGGIAMLAISIITLTFSFMAASARDGMNAGIITGYKVTLLSEPYATAKGSSTPLTRGTRLDILDIEKDAKDKVEWYKVRLNSDFVGWIHAADFEEI